MIPLELSIIKTLKKEQGLQAQGWGVSLTGLDSPFASFYVPISALVGRGNQMM